MSSAYYHPDADYYRKVLKTEPPKTTTHITEEDMMRNLTPAKTYNWRLEGSLLICDSDLGKISQTIPPDYVCQGTDTNGRPILTKIKL